MLAAILLNLADYQKPARDADAGRYRFTEKDLPRKKELKKAISAFANLLDKAQEPALNPLKKVKQRVQEYTTTDLPVDEFSDLIRELSMREFELRRSINRSSQQDPISILILEQLTIVLTFMQQDEEEILVLLMG